MYEASKLETLAHINRVRNLLQDFAVQLLERGRIHDESKMESPEVEGFANISAKLKDLEYGSDEYRAALKELKSTIEHHYNNNSHHPEFYKNGIDDMDLLDLVEMFFDWKAASERHTTGNIYESIEINKDRFSMSEQLCNIFNNTAQRMFNDRI